MSNPKPNIPPSKSLKRKQPPQSSSSSQHGPSNSHARKRQKTVSARSIPTQTTSSISANGEIDLGAYVSAREFEIRALEKSMASSKTVLASRAFQSLPRSMRRRTASHNVKRVPKRLRRRAKREMAEDKTPTVNSKTRARNVDGKARLRRDVKSAIPLARGILAAKKARDQAKNDSKPRKNTLSSGPKGPAKFRKRQLHKSWLPTHMFHAKRAHMTAPSDPLWRFAIPLSPNEKCYRTSHRAAALRGCIAFDTSYMSTIACTGTQTALLSLIKRMSRRDLQTKEKWIAGARSLELWMGMADDDGKEVRKIAPVVAVWAPETERDAAMDDGDDAKKKTPFRTLWLRVHPAAFHDLWDVLLINAKKMHPPVSLEDLRFEVGSVEMQGPAVMETLIAALKMAPLSTETSSFAKQWPSFAAVTSPDQFPQHAVMHLTVQDPRLNYPPRKVNVDSIDRTQLAHDLFTFKPPSVPSSESIFDRKFRHASERAKRNEKYIISRRTAFRDTSGSQSALVPVEDADPRIPIVLLTTSPTKASYTLLTPWKWLSTIWYSLMHTPLSTGGNPRFGGLTELRQLRFEESAPWFPGDFPGTDAGWEWEVRERKARLVERLRRPKSVRTMFEKIDLGKGQIGEVGLGWGSDWAEPFVEEDTRGKVKESTTTNAEGENGDVDASVDATLTPSPGLAQLCRKQDLLQLSVPRLLATVSITMLEKGVPSACSRIYAFPSASSPIFKAWNEHLTLLRNASTVSKKNLCKPTLPRLSGANAEASSIVRRFLRGIHDPDSVREENILPCPAREELLGFVTTGNYNLSDGRGSGVGSLAWMKVSEEQRKAREGLCLVRKSGMRVCRVARWRVVLSE